MKKLLVQLNVSLLVVQSKFNPYKPEIVCRGKAILQALPAYLAANLHTWRPSHYPPPVDTVGSLQLGPNCRPRIALPRQMISRLYGLNFDCATSSDTFNCTNIFFNPYLHIHHKTFMGLRFVLRLFTFRIPNARRSYRSKFV